MRTQRKIFTLLAIVTCITTSTAMFGQQAIANGPDPEAGSVPQKTLSIDGDYVHVAGHDETCAATGGFGQSFFPFNPNPYRGIVFQVDDTTVLNYIFIELDFGSVSQPVPAQASFSVHRASIGSNDYTPVFVQAPITLMGEGRKFYSNGIQKLDGGNGVVLEAGFNYAIGINWDDTDIRFFRDTPINNLYPQDFPGDALIPDGSILGSLGKDFQDLPLTDDPFSTSAPFSSSAYSMQLCLEPKTGACCDAMRFGGCEEVLEKDCTNPGSFFQGQQTVCEPGRCQIGACCLRCDDGGGSEATCKNDYVREQCVAELGDWQGSTVTCAAGLCPIVTGACCVPDMVGTGVTTVEMCESECIVPVDPAADPDDPDTKRGVYRGDGTPLVPSPCEGACCLSNTGCSTLSPGDCGGFSGIYRGDGTECNNLEPALECGGACCFGTGGVLNSCNNFGTRAECVDAGGLDTAYGGDSSTCGGTSCSNLTSLGGCCLPDGTCVNATFTTCTSDSMLGIFNATCVGGADDGLPCDLDIDCGDDVGTCGNKECVGGTSPLNTPCSSNLGCLAFNGTCVGTCTGGSNDTFACLDDNGCPDVISACVGTSCDLLTCDTEECCFDDGHCEDISATACTARGASPAGMGTTCSAASCPTLRGGCCLNDGTCEVFTELACDVAGGRYLGVATDCLSGTCPTLGSCCRPNHSCTELVTQTECALFGGIFNSDPDCANTMCPGTGGCCTETATCLTLSQIECMAITGTYFGDDSVCDVDAICPTGACCAQDGICSNVNQFVCDQIAGTYLGDTMVCNVNAFCSTGACCLPDASCADLTSFGCTSSGGVYHGDGTVCPDDSGRCLVNVCGGGPNDGMACSTVNDCPQGVCPLAPVCFGGDSDGNSCLIDNDCRTRLCTFGSCCETNGNCVDGIIDLQCDLSVTPTATFTLDATCADCPQEGACCFGDESCVQMLENDCVSAGGFFQGDSTPCPANGQGGLCTLGACCELDGTCNDGVRRSDCDAFPFSIYSAGQMCNQVSCTPRGACCTGVGSCTDDVAETNCAGSNNYAGDGSICQADTCELGACCLVPTCEGGVDDGSPCDLANGNDDCDDIVATCLADVCREGPRQGLPCTTASECPFSLCLINNPTCIGGINHGVGCNSDAECVVEQGVCSNGASLPACVGGADDGKDCDINNGNSDCDDDIGNCEFLRVCEGATNFSQPCTSDSGCIAAPNKCIIPGLCGAGTDQGNPCANDADCVNNVCLISSTCQSGVNQGAACTHDDDCPSSVCLPPRTCDGGSNGGNVCVSDVDCPASVCLRPGICRNGANDNESCSDDSDCMTDVGICYSPDHCSQETDVVCQNINGLPQGVGTTCSPGDCEIGSCCNSAGVCLDGVPVSSCDDPADFRIHESCASQTCEARGACCHAGGCDVVSLDACVGMGGLDGTYESDTTICDPVDLCTVGACCMFDGSCAQLTRQSCEDGGGIYAGSSLPCDGSVDCSIGSCCLSGNSCLVDTVVNICNAMNGSFTAGGNCSNPVGCLQILSSDPASGVADARIPHDPNTISLIFGTDRVEITFDADATSLMPADFTIVEVGGDANASVPIIVSVNVNVGGDPKVVALNLSRNLDLSTWSTITHTDSGSQACLGVAPADVDSNGTVEPADISAHVTNLDTVGASELSTDIDRSGSPTSLDIIELISLQTGAGGFADWSMATPLGAPPCN